MKTALLALGFFVIVGALISAGVFMIKKQDDSQAKSKRMANALTVRIGLSVAVFLLLLFSWRMGWIKQAGIPVKETGNTTESTPANTP